MKKQLIWLFLAAVIISSSECQINETVGTGVIESIPLQIFYSDTLSLKFTTVLFDSLKTSSDNRLLVGRTNDPELGDITSSAYFQINTDSMLNVIPIRGQIEFKSLTMYCIYDHYWYYDTLTDFTMSVYPVLQDIKNRNDGYIYNVDHYNYDSTQNGSGKIGQVQFRPQPYGRRVEIPINNDFSEIFYNYLREKGNISVADLQKKFKGFALVPGDGNQCFIGFSTNTRLALAYLNAGVEDTLNFWVKNNILFNHIKSNRDNCNLKNLKTQNFGIDSKETNSLCFIQGGVGLATKVTFPNIRSLRELGQSIVITQAKLDLYPQKNSYNDVTLLTSKLILFSVDKYNRIIASVPATGLLTVDFEFNRDTYYEVDITDFIQQLINDPLSDDNGMLFVFDQPYFNSAVNKLLITDGSKGGNTKIKMKMVTAQN